MTTDPFIDPAALPTIAPLRYLDARDKASFDAGHAPGAIHVPSDAWDKAAKTPGSGFETTAFWQDALGSLGLDPSVTAVAYDTGAMTNAARVWFVLQYFGLNCLIVNGGWPAMAGVDLPPGAGPSTVPFQAVPANGAVGLVDRATLQAQLDGSAVFDSRTLAEYTGEDSRGRMRAGHLPGARHLSHADLMTKGIVHPAPVLRGMMEKVGFQPGDHIVTHCEGGGRAALAAAAALRAGYGDVHVYYLSFGDWAKDETCPIVRG